MTSARNFFFLMVGLTALFATSVVTASPADASVVQPGDVLVAVHDCTGSSDPLTLTLPDAAEAVEVGDDGGDAAGAGANAVRWTEPGGAAKYHSIVSCSWLQVWTGPGPETVTVAAVDSAIHRLVIYTVDNQFQDISDDQVTLVADAPTRETSVYLGAGDDALRVPIDFGGKIYAEGGPGSDIIQGGANEDVIFGGTEDFGFLIGNGDATDRDRLFGRGGEDQLNGAVGHDLLKGGGDTDWMWGGTTGDDVLLGGPDTDVITGSGGDNVIRGQGGNDIIEARGGNDTIHGGGGNDAISGGPGDDMIYGQSGMDYLQGNHSRAFGTPVTDDDILRGGAGDDTLIGDDGFDECLGNKGTADEADSETCEIIRGVEVLF